MKEILNEWRRFLNESYRELMQLDDYIDTFNIGDNTTVESLTDYLKQRMEERPDLKGTIFKHLEAAARYAELGKPEKAEIAAQVKKNLGYGPGNETPEDDYYISKMEPISYEEATDLIKDPRLKAVTQIQEDPGREYYKIEMSDGEILIGDYDPAEQDMRVYDENDEEVGEEYDRAALEYIQQDAPYDQERFPSEEPEDDLEEGETRDTYDDEVVKRNDRNSDQARTKMGLAEEEVEEGKICDKGISYVIRTDPGGKDIKRGKDKDGDGKGDLQNWSARAAQIASKYCKDPNYGKGRGKDAKRDDEISEDCWDGYERVPGSKEGAPGSCRKKTNEELEDGDKEELNAITGELAKASKMHKGQSDALAKASKMHKGQSDRIKKIAKKVKVKDGEGGLKAWEKENWTHSDGTPCGGGKKDGSKSRCKPASKWKTMSKGQKAADNRKKAKGTKAGKQYVKSSHPVTKKHTKRAEESLERLIKNTIQEVMHELEEGAKCTGPTKKASSTSKGKKWMQCVKSDSGGYKRIHWGQKGVRVTGGSGNTKRKKSFKKRHNCAKAKSNTPQGKACKDWAEE